jgi:hypothetical protein
MTDDTPPTPLATEASGTTGVVSEDRSLALRRVRDTQPTSWISARRRLIGNGDGQDRHARLLPRSDPRDTNADDKTLPGEKVEVP